MWLLVIVLYGFIAGVTLAVILKVRDALHVETQSEDPLIAFFWPIAIPIVIGVLIVYGAAWLFSKLARRLS